jgi:hypothetical protein
MQQCSLLRDKIGQINNVSLEAKLKSIGFLFKYSHKVTRSKINGYSLLITIVVLLLGESIII